MNPVQKPVDELGYSDKSLLTCCLCDKQFVSLLNFQIHARGHLLGPYRCNRCTREYSSEFDFKDHICSTGEVPFSCDVCSVRFFSKQKFSEHLQSHYAAKTFKCSECGEVSPSPFKSHVCKQKETDSSTKGSHVCEVCRKCFFSELNLHIHQRVHAEKTCFTCKDCRAKVPISCMQEHICFNILRGSSVLVVPVRHVCKICFKDCLTRWELMHHRITHKLEKGRYCCHICHKHYFRKVNLIVHSLRHKNREIYSCEKCKKRFSKNFINHHHCSEITIANCPQIDSVKFDRVYSSDKSMMIIFFDTKTKNSLKCKESIKLLKQDNLLSHVKLQDKSEQISCPSGDQKFFTEKESKDHSKIHIPKCEVCGKLFATQNALLKHMRRHNKQKQFFCPECDDKFFTKKELQIHFKGHGESLLFCQFCKEAFPNMERFSQHLVTVHTGVQKYWCNICQLHFPTRREWLVHDVIHSGKPLYVCKHCGKQFLVKKVLSEHVWRHEHEADLLKCERCRKVFRTDVDLKSHAELELQKCSFCAQEFCYKWKLQYHIKKLHSTVKPYECSFCQKRFKTQGRLTDHLRIHANVRPYECHICEKKFHRHVRLKYHLYTHFDDKDKPYKCNICHKGFEMGTLLKYHYRRHTGEKPSMCEVCGKTFVTKPALTMHQRSHTTERPFKCNDCGKGFKFNCILRQHRYKHSSEKPFPCNLCNRGFIYKSVLEKHLELHKRRGKRLFYCDMCNKNFTSEKYLQKHQQNHK